MGSKIRDMALPKSDHPAAVLCGVIGVILFVLLALNILPRVHTQGTMLFLSHTAGMALLMVSAGFGYLFGYNVGDQIDMLLSCHTKQADEVTVADIQPEPDNIANIEEYRERRRTSR